MPAARALDSAGGDEAGKLLKAAIVGPFHIVRDAARGQLPGRQVIAQALAAQSFAIAAWIRAIAVFHILGLLTFHRALISSWIELFEVDCLKKASL